MKFVQQHTFEDFAKTPPGNKVAENLQTVVWNATPNFREAAAPSGEKVKKEETELGWCSLGKFGDESSVMVAQ